MPGIKEKKELARLLELKKMQDDKKFLDSVLQNELDELNKKYTNDAALSDVDAEKKRTPTPTSVTFQNKGDLEVIIQSYIDQFSNNPGYKPPLTKNGMTTLFFASEEEAVNFAITQAAAGRKFQIVDDKHCILAYSNGDGKFYHANNKVFNKGESFVEPVIPVKPEPIKAPEPAEKPAVTPAPKPTSM